MATKPRKKSAKKAAPAPSGRPAKGASERVLFRIPPNVLEGVDRRAKAENLSRNDALIKAALDFGHFPEGRPKVAPEKRRASAAAAVATAKPDPVAPGSRLDKKEVGRRKGPAIPKAPVPVAEEAV